MNSKVLIKLARIFSQGLSIGSGHIANVPFVYMENIKIDTLVRMNISFSKQDWDSHETSWDFEENPLLSYINKEIAEGETEKSYKIESLYNLYTTDWEERFMQLHANEEELNRQFIEIYGLQDELTPDVPLDEVTILQQGEISIKD